MLKQTTCWWRVGRQVSQFKLERLNLNASLWCSVSIDYESVNKPSGTFTEETIWGPSPSIVNTDMMYLDVQIG